MDLKVVFLYLMLCVVITKSKDCHKNSGDRFKRSKYFPYPPPGAVKYYRKPPMVYHPGIPGFGGNSVISYTPPPNYMEEYNTHSQSPYGNRPPYVSKRPTNDGLGDDDINNIVKYLSKQDLDKIIEYAGEKDGKRPAELERDVEVEFNGNVDGTKYSNKPTYGEKDDRFSRGGFNWEDNAQINYNSNSQDFANEPLESMIKYRTIFNPYNQDNNNIRPNNQNVNTNTPFTQESAQSYKVAHPGPLPLQTSNIQESIQSYKPYTLLQASTRNIANVSGLDQEDYLPKPVNLRDDQDIEGEYTRNIEVVASPTYKVESFGDLPVMDYHSKRFSVSSYNVPHYSITSNSRPTNTPAIEPAPDRSAARAQSDAHLKAVRIWTHRSTGKAYTLHNDGSLSIERPLRPKRSLE